MNRIINILILFIILLPINITNNYFLNLIIKSLIFILTLSYLIKFTDPFTVCPPGFKMRDASNSINDPYHSWCEYSGQNKTDELIENDSDENEEEEEENQENNDRIKAKTKICGPDSKYMEDSYYEDRKSWCKLNN